MMKYSRSDSPYLCAVLLVFLAFCGIALPSFVMLIHNDLGWHIAAGDWIREQRIVPDTDLWSYSADGFRWINLAWGWDVLASLVYQAAGLEGHLLLTFAMGGICLWLMYRLALALGAAEKPAALTCGFAMLCLPFYGIPDIFLSSTPQLVSYILILCLLLVLQRRNFLLWQPPLLLWLWVNMHNSFPLGLLILGLYGVEALWQRDSSHFKRLLLSGIAAFALTFVNPYGWEAYAVVLRNQGHIHQDYVTEWQPLYTLFSGAFVLTFLPCLILLGMYGAMLLWCVMRKQRAVQLPLLALSLLMLAGALLQYRFFSLWLLVSAPLIASSVKMEAPKKAPLKPLIFYLAVLLAIFPWLIAFHYPQDVKPAGFRYPEKAAAYVAQHYPRAKVVNHWNMGSWLILYHRNKIRPLIDGRAATAYPDAVFEKLVPLWRDHSPEAWVNLLEAYPPDAILWLANDTENLNSLHKLKNWKEVYRDADSVVFAPAK